MNPLAFIRTYWNIAVGIVLLLVVLSTVSYIMILRHQLAASRASLIASQRTVIDYQRASQAAIAHAIDLAKLAEEVGIEDAATINKLKVKLPANDEEARKMAIEAGSTIGGLR